MKYLEFMFQQGPNMKKHRKRVEKILKEMCPSGYKFDCGKLFMDSDGKLYLEWSYVIFNDSEADIVESIFNQ